MIKHVSTDIESLCKSPHDRPAKWSLMLTMYLDESIEKDDGFAVVAGFIGGDSAWKECMRQWEMVTGRPAKGWHMADFRAKECHREVLKTLGEIPRNSELILVFGSVRLGDYRDLAAGTLAEIVQSGYMIALSALVSQLMVRLNPLERVEIIFETQIEYAAMRELFLQIAQGDPEWRTPEGLPRIAKWSSMPKSMILEPSDYAAYSLLQRLRDPQEFKSRLFGPILANPSRVGWCMTEQFPRALVSAYCWPTMSKREQSDFRARLKNVIGKGNVMTEQGQFDQGMAKVLKADPKVVKAAMEQEKEEREAERQAKRSSSSAPVSSDREG